MSDVRQVHLTFRESFNFFLQVLIQLGLLNLFFWVVMTAFRVFSHFYYGDLKSLAPLTSEVFRAYWIGARFDLSALCYLAVIPLLLLSAVSFIRNTTVFKKTIQLIKYYYSLMWGLLFICLICDTGYYSYFQDHLNVLLFGLFEDDTMALLKTVWRNYPVPYFIILFCLCLYGTHRLMNYLLNQKNFVTLSFKIHPLWLPLPVILVSLGARGSLGLFPLSVQDTVVSGHAFINHLSYNGFHAFIRAVKLRNQQDNNWDLHLKYYQFSSAKEAFSDYFDIPIEKIPDDPLTLIHKKTALNPWAEKNKPHVLVLMMESMGSAYLHFNSPTFNVLGDLKNHFDQDFVTYHFLPSHSSTIGSLSSFMIASPQRPLSGFLTESDLLQVPFRSSPANVFSQKNYVSRFVYGGNPGWRDVNKFARFQGFSLVEGEVDIEKKLGTLKEKHDWGVYDEDVFEYLYQTLAAAEKPQFILAMTTTNHPPYQIPSSYKPLPLQLPEALKEKLIAGPELVQSRFQAYQYSNQKLSEFLNRIKNSPLADNLIVAVTGDHSFWMVQFSDDEIFYKWGVPFYLYTPAAIKPLPQKTIFGSHMDILPTLYNLALSETEYHALGSNLFAERTDNYAFFTGDIAVADFGGIRSQKGNQFLSYKWEGSALTPTEASTAHERLAKKYKSLMAVTDLYYLYEKRGKEKK